MIKNSPEELKIKVATEKMLSAEKNISLVRFLIILLNTLIFLLLMDHTGSNVPVAYTVIIIANVYALYVLILRPYKRFPVFLASWFTYLTDAALITLWLYATGGFESPFYLLWSVSIIAVAFRFDPSVILITCVVYIVCYVGLLIKMNEFKGNETDIIIRCCYILITALIGSLITRETMEQARKKVLMQLRVEQGKREQETLLSEVVRSAKSEKESRLLLTVTLATASAKDYETALEFALNKICEATDVILAEAWSYNKTGKLELKSIYYSSQESRFEEFSRLSEDLLLSPGEGLPGMALQRKNSVWTNEAVKEEYFVRKESAEKAGIKAGVALPIPLHDEVIAVLAFYFNKPLSEDKEFVATVTAIAGQLGMILQQKQMEYSLLESEKRFRSLAESSPEAIVISDNKGDIISINEGGLKMFGYTSNEILGKPLEILMPEQFRAAHRAGIERFKSTGVSKVMHKILELWGLKKSGEQFPIELSLSFWKTKDDLYFSGIIRDITERKNQEQNIIMLKNKLESKVIERTAELTMSEERFQILSESIPQMVFTATAKGKIDYYNKRWYDYTGFTKNTLSGPESWGVVVHPDDIKNCIERWDKAINTEQEFVVECRFRAARGGRYKWFLGQAMPLKSHGKVLKWFGTFTDITEQKRLNAQKDEFVGIASHELKTPLTSIKAYLQLLERNIKDEQNKTFVVKTNKHIDRLNMLISDLLDVSKIQAGKLAFNITEFDFDHLVDESIESVQHSTQSHKIKREGKRLKVKIKGDKQRLEQVFINFLTNSIKYSPKGNEVIVTTEIEGDHVKVGVQDFGIGIAKEKQKRIFDRFYRVDNLSPTFSGLGIGLYISATIIKRHNGKVWVESEEGKGSTFYFTIPITFFE